MKVDIAANKDGNINTSLDSLCEAVLFLMDKWNHPVYIHCNQGKHRTGCVVACLRKIQKMPIDEALQEYVNYSSPKDRAGDKELIKSFNPEVVFEYAKKNGYFGGPQPKMHRLDSTITDIDTLSEALLSGATEGVAWADIPVLSISPSSVISDEMSISRADMAATTNYVQTGSNGLDVAVYTSQSKGTAGVMDTDVVQIADDDLDVSLSEPLGKVAELNTDALAAAIHPDNLCFDARMAATQ